jgi:predicted O-methyltransferase YrrM
MLIDMPEPSLVAMELSLMQPPFALDQIVAQTEALGFSMASEPRTGAFLRTLAASKPTGEFLELGTGTGIATAWLLAGMDSASKLTSVDTDAQAQSVAREFLGSDRRLRLVLEDGLAFLAREPAAHYDFVFADAMPGKYEGLQECLRVVKPGGFYVIDDMLPQANWPTGHAEKIPVLVQELAGDPNWEVVPLAWSSGIVVAVKRSIERPMDVSL